MADAFQSMSQDLKVEFFIKCQELMLKFHPASPMIIRESNLKIALDAFQSNVLKYRGFQHRDDNICVLWNHIIISDAEDVNLAIKENAYKEPNPNYNAVSIDFAVFRKMEDCLDFVRKNYEPRIKFVLFVRGGNPRIYPIEQLLKGIGVNEV